MDICRSLISIPYPNKWSIWDIYKSRALKCVIYSTIYVLHTDQASFFELSAQEKLPFALVESSWMAFPDA